MGSIPVRVTRPQGRICRVGVYGNEVPPVPIPNTEVKLIHVEDTWLETARENRSMPALQDSSIAQSVEHLTVNQGVTGSSPVGGAKTSTSVRLTGVLFSALIRVKQPGFLSGLTFIA